jgi:hypothetical protein
MNCKTWESGKNRGVRGQAGAASRTTGMGNRGYQCSEGVLEAAFQDRQPDLNEQVGAAPAPAHLLFFGHAPLDHPVDHRFNDRRGDALA